VSIVLFEFRYITVDSLPCLFVQPAIDQYMAKLNSIINQQKVSTRIKFMLQDVIELRSVRAALLCSVRCYNTGSDGQLTEIYRLNQTVLHLKHINLVKLIVINELMNEIVMDDRLP